MRLALESGFGRFLVRSGDFTTEDNDELKVIHPEICWILLDSFLSMSTNFGSNPPFLHAIPLGLSPSFRGVVISAATFCYHFRGSFRDV